MGAPEGADQPLQQLGEDAGLCRGVQIDDPAESCRQQTAETS